MFSTFRLSFVICLTVSAGLTWVLGLLMLQLCSIRPIQEIGPRTDEKKKSLLYFGYDFSGWYNFEKIFKTVATRCHI